MQITQDVAENGNVTEHFKILSFIKIIAKLGTLSN